MSRDRINIPSLSISDETRVARRLCKSLGLGPETLVTRTEPRRIATPFGTVFLSDPKPERMMDVVGDLVHKVFVCASLTMQYGEDRDEP